MSKYEISAYRTDENTFCNGCDKRIADLICIYIPYATRFTYVCDSCKEDIISSLKNV